MIRKPRWISCTGPGIGYCRHDLPPEIADWLLDSGSLTTRLQAQCRACSENGRFRVEVLSQAWGRPQRHEAQQLDMRRGAVALIREVRLLCDGRPWVFARTVIPRSSLQGSNRILAHLGNRPLGGFLFAQRSLQRGPMQVTRISAEYWDEAKGGDSTGSGTSVWGRRSTFFLRGHPLLVAEFFLPEMVV